MRATRPDVFLFFHQAQIRLSLSSRELKHKRVQRVKTPDKKMPYARKREEKKKHFHTENHVAPRSAW